MSQYCTCCTKQRSIKKNKNRLCFGTRAGKSRRERGNKKRQNQKSMSEEKKQEEEKCRERVLFYLYLYIRISLFSSCCFSNNHDGLTNLACERKKQNLLPPPFVTHTCSIPALCVELLHSSASTLCK